MGKRLSTISDFMGRYSTIFRNSASEQDSIITAMQDGLNAVLDNTAMQDVSLNRPCYRPSKHANETNREFVQRLCEQGDVHKCSKGAASSIIRVLKENSFTVTNNSGVSFAILPRESNVTFYSDIHVKMTTGQIDSAYPGLYFLNALVFEYENQYYLSNWLFPSTTLSNSSYSDYLREVLPERNSLLDSDVFFKLLARLEKRNVPSGYSSVSYGIHLFNNLTNLGLTAEEEAQLTGPAIMNLYFGDMGSYDASDVAAFITGIIPIIGTSYVSFSQFMSDLADSLAINNINVYVSSALASTSSAIDRIATFVSSIKPGSSSIADYVATLQGALTTDEETFAGKFAQLWNSAKAQRDNDDGSLMVFQDRASAAPVKFLSGIVAAGLSIAFDVIGTALVIIGGALAKIIGIVLTGIGTLISVIRNASENAVYATLTDKYNVACLPFSEFTLTNGGLSYLNDDTASLLNQFGFVTFNYPFAKFFLYKVGENNYEVAICPVPVSKTWMSSVMEEISTNSIIRLDSHDHCFLTGYQKLADLREFMASTEDSFEIIETQGLSSSDFDAWLRKSCAYGVLATRLFLLLQQGTQGEIRPYNLNGTAAYGNSSVRVNSMLQFFYNGSTSLAAVESTTPSWRQVLGVDSFSYSFAPDLFLDISLSDVSYGTDQQIDRTFFYHQSDIINAMMGYTEEEYIWTMDETPQSVYHIPVIDFSSAVIGGIALAIVTIAVTVTAVIVSTKVKRARQRSAAMHAAKAEAAWQTFTTDTSAENYDVFRKATRSNNIASNWNGGDRISKYSYWADVGDSNAAGSPDNSKMFSRIEKLITG